MRTYALNGHNTCRCFKEELLLNIHWEGRDLLVIWDHAHNMILYTCVYFCRLQLVAPVKSWITATHGSLWSIALTAVSQTSAWCLRSWGATCSSSSLLQTTRDCQCAPSSGSLSRYSTSCAENASHRCTCVVDCVLTWALAVCGVYVASMCPYVHMYVCTNVCRCRGIVTHYMRAASGHTLDVYNNIVQRLE